MNNDYESAYSRFISFVSLLVARCTKFFPVHLTRPSVPAELIPLLARSRSVAFKAKRMGDILLRQEAKHLRNMARFELRHHQKTQLAQQLRERHSSSESSTIFWSQTKRHFRTPASTLGGFPLPSGETLRDPQALADTAAGYYEKLYAVPTVVRPHPYVDAPPIIWDNSAEAIPAVTYPETLVILRARKKKKSLDIHGLSPYILDKIPRNFWHLLIRLYNYSFSSGLYRKSARK